MRALDPLVAAWWRGFRLTADAWAYYAVVGALGAFHLAEVNLLDPTTSAWARAATGWDFGAFAAVETPLARMIGGAQPDPLVAAVTVYYLLGYVALLMWVPPLVAATGDARLLKRTLLAYPALYLVALPFYLFFAADNPYVRIGAAPPFDLVHPDLEEIYYLLTTRNNTFPSLHVGFTVVLVVQILRSRHDLLKPAFVVHGAMLVASVVYLRVHWVGDAVGGALAAWAALAIADRWVDGPVGRALDRASAWGRAQRQDVLDAVESRVVRRT